MTLRDVAGVVLWVLDCDGSGVGIRCDAVVAVVSLGESTASNVGSL